MMRLGVDTEFFITGMVDVGKTLTDADNLTRKGQVVDVHFHKVDWPNCSARCRKPHTLKKENPSDV